jgi:cell division protein FtsN
LVTRPLTRPLTRPFTRPFTRPLKKEHAMKIVLHNRPKPRNPVARALQARHGGVHARTESARRQAEQRAMQRELVRWKPPTK